jgi:hypothetical protein
MAACVAIGLTELNSFDVPICVGARFGWAHSWFLEFSLRKSTVSGFYSKLLVSSPAPPRAALCRMNPEDINTLSRRLANFGGFFMPDRILTDIISEYLPYEIDMLRLTYKELEARRAQVEQESVLQQTLRLALIESFCVHARSLINFFYDKRVKPTDTIATDFANGFKTGLDVQTEPLKSIIHGFNKQIFHLTRDRTVEQAEKFNVGSDGADVLRLIVRKLQRVS